MSAPTRMTLTVLVVASLWGCGSSDPANESDPPIPLLIEAAERGDLSALDALLDLTANPDLRDACQWTALMKAALNGHRESVLRLLAAGAKVDTEDSGGYTAMMLAASNNQADVVGLLLDSGAMVNHQERTRGWTALIWASKQGHTETVERLLDQGADGTLRDTRGNTAADWARAEGQDTVLRLLNSGMPAVEHPPAVGSRHPRGYDSIHAEPAREDGPARIRVQ